jgi:pyridinium-3,5-bisthiocarboxylic acid mononucleotide nickel chelatase
MRIAYFDTIAGIAGDMTLAAFISAGLSLDELSAELRKLGIGGFELHAVHVRRSHIDAVHVDVAITDPPKFHRDPVTIDRMIASSALSEGVKSTARRIFAVLAQAEATVHNVALEKIHFHEVGALDSIVDIVGTAIALERMGIERIYSSPVRLGSGGLITTQHGIMPVPAPATLEILRGYPTVLTSIPHELTTPTGAAIIRALSAGVLDTERVILSAIGYGAGTKEFTEVPNFLRIMIGELPGQADEEEIVTVETNIDDMNPQIYPALIEELLTAGAHDAYLVPIIMKKGRPGILLSVMSGRTTLDTVIGIIYRQTTTIGLRIQQVGRRKLPRRHLEIATSFGPVKAKAVLRDGKEVIAPEFEEVRRIAQASGRPLPEILRALEQEIQQQLSR